MYGIKGKISLEKLEKILEQIKDSDLSDVKKSYLYKKIRYNFSEIECMNCLETCKNSIECPLKDVMFDIEDAFLEYRSSARTLKLKKSE